MIYDTSSLSVFIDLSTYCNAGCPQCHRTNPKNLEKNDWLPLVQWSLEEFKNAFSIEDMASVKTFKICGTFGDPILNKDIFKIVEYIMRNSFCSVSIDTNGSIRNEDWWWDFGVMAGKRLGVVFAVDGINQEMHETYRRFTDLNKVLANMEMLSQTTATVKSQTILFKHNQDYKKEIQDLVYSKGSSFHEVVISDRFDRFSNTREYGGEGAVEEFKLIKASSDSLKNPYISGARNLQKSPQPKDLKTVNSPAQIQAIQIQVKPQQAAKPSLTHKIKCRWGLPRNEILINPDGQVLPCCYHGNNLYRESFGQFYDEKNKLKDNPHYAEYMSNKEKYNIFTNDIKSIMESDFFTHDLEKSFDSDSPIPTCALNCSSRIKKEHQLREKFKRD